MIHFLFPLLLMATDAMTPNPNLNATLSNLRAAANELPSQVTPERLAELDALAAWIAVQPTSEEAALIFICTHNSRRSHMGQIWAQAAAYTYGLDHVRTYSGGTEATAFNPRAIRALRKLGVDIAAQGDRHRVQLQADKPSFEVFSKIYSDASNPQSGFAAVMTCSDADEACPLVFGADARFATPYVDPKVSDGTPEEASTYQARALEIGAEMFYVMARAAAGQK